MLSFMYQEEVRYARDKGFYIDTLEQYLFQLPSLFMGYGFSYATQNAMCRHAFKVYGESRMRLSLRLAFKVNNLNQLSLIAYPKTSNHLTLMPLGKYVKKMRKDMARVSKMGMSATEAFLTLYIEELEAYCKEAKIDLVNYEKIQVW